MAVFTFGSIEDAPVDALAEGKNSDNPISQGYFTVAEAWKMVLTFSLAGLVLHAIGSTGTIMVPIGLLGVGGIYFHHGLRLRQSLVLDALGFTILASVLPFLCDFDMPFSHFLDKSLVVACLAFFLCYASYYLLIELLEKTPVLGREQTKLSLGIMFMVVLIAITTLLTFTFSDLVPGWVSFLMLVLFLIMVYPKFARRATIQPEAYIQLILSIYQRALAIALATFFLATQIFSILR